MVITKKTKTKDIIPFLNAERMDTILSAVDEYQLEKPLLEMTISEFIECLDPEYPMMFLTEKYLYKAFGRLKSFRRQLDDITRYLELNKTEPTADQKKAANGVVFPTFEENMLFTVTEYFHLKSFDEAENVKLSNYLLIAKKTSADAKYQYNWNKIMEYKQKTKNGKR